ncbi:hypothetical protein DAPPUDRAFT_303904 [Daphnia pulex]|uniref:Syndecan n=1 Tax=Daphnia pulex TaxID=6669 RepID=E9GI95_DAPPU|nr:hypothetical protein DAPPUDRAFT_303904 [Daphnia pulex]|eukprot:EFX80810.1 hypothetical protein DAPPUDRAFT_303904 [Daphnia pulex]
MNPRIHMAIFIAFLAAHSVSSNINSASSVAKQQQVSGLNLKALDDLYIDDEGDDDIQLADEASGLGPLKPALGVEDEEEEEEEEEDEEEVDEYDDNPAPVEAAKKAKDAGTTATATTNSGGGSSNNNMTAGIISSSDYKDDVVAPPKVSPVAASPTMGKPPAPAVEDDEDDENFDGSGGSGAGTGSNVDDENEDEDDYDDTVTDEEGGGIDLGSVITEPAPKTTMKPEKKPEVVVVAPPTAPSSPTKAPKETTQAPSSPPPLSGGRDENQVPAEPMTTPVPGPVDPSQGSGGSMDGNRGHNDVQILDHKPDERQASFFAQPGILAAVIGGAVVGLLCAILLVMFIVYRMRKKDEGSYVLDEPKRNSPNSNPYNKNSREFYA